MPRSKRDIKVSLTKTEKKGLENKRKVIDDIQESTDQYDNIFIFSVDNMRNHTLKHIRSEWKDSRFFFGKNAVMQLGLKNAGVNEEFIERIQGQRGLLFTSHDRDTVVEWFEEYSAAEFARSGFVASETVKLPAGPLPDFSHAIEPHLRKLGMPTKLERGIVTLITEYVVCEKGKTLTPEQARILKLLGTQMATFKVNVECFVTNKENFEEIQSQKTDTKGKKKSLNTAIKKAKDKVKKVGKKPVAAASDDDSMDDESDEDEAMSDE